MMSMRDAVRELRNALGLTQPELGRLLGLTKRTIIQYENHLPPRGMTLLKFAELAEDVKREDLAFVFRADLIRELDEAHTTRPALEGLLAQYLMGRRNRPYPPPNLLENAS